jgi:hypothetical protein
MENNKPATPAQAATPGQAQVPATPAVTPAPTGDSGNNQEGKVTISTKEFAQLQRDAARARSNDKRNQINNRKNPSVDNPNNDPEINKVLDEANNRALEAERKALQFQVKGQVRDLLEKDEFKNLPKSTKELILKNPQLLSEADNLEEAMLDIEDFLRDEVLSMETSQSATQVKTDQPTGHETPPAIQAGGPAPVINPELEDISKLSGPARSQAMIRNKLKVKK